MPSCRQAKLLGTDVEGLVAQSQGKRCGTAWGRRESQPGSRSSDSNREETGHVVKALRPGLDGIGDVGGGGSRAETLALGIEVVGRLERDHLRLPPCQAILI